MGKSVRMRSPMVILTLLALIARSHTSHNDAEADDFMGQDDIYNSQMMLDNLALSTEEQESMTSSLLFKPTVIDFLQRSIGDPHDQVVILFNKHKNRSVYLGSITGNSPDFHCKYFKDVLIPPEGNTTFNVVFMPRKLGITHGSLVIHTSFGILKYHMRGEGTECLYRLKPLVGLKAPLNATITPEIVLYNPHAARLQITEIASSSGEFQLELPTGATEGPRELWEIPPFSTKTLIRVRFTGKVAGNHTAYVRIKMGIGSDPMTQIEKILIVPIEIEIMKETGIYSKIPFLDFGVVGSNDNVMTKLNLNLLNSGEKFIRLRSWGVEGDLEAIMCIKVNVQRFTRNENIADRLFIEIDWSKVTEDKKFLTGNIYITTSMEKDDSESNGSDSNEIIYRIPFAGQILKGSIEYDENVLRFLILNDKNSIENSRDVIIRNKFNVPLSITNITVPENCSANFLIDGFKTNVIQPNKESTLFQITRSLTKNLNKTISTYIKLITNITEYELPVFSYTGRLQRIVPLDGSIKYQLQPDLDDEEQLDFGILPISTTGESLIGFVNNNPISIPINNWKGTIEPGSKGTATITVIMKGCGTLTMEKELVFCHTIKPGEWVVFYVSVHSSSIDTFYGKFTIETDYEEIITPIRFKTAMGRLELNKELLHFQNCFPGRLCTLNLTAYSTFLSTMKVEGISADVEGIKYDFSNESFDDDLPEIPPNVITSIGQLVFDPKAECKVNCYSSFDLLSKPFGVKWMATLDNYEQYHKLDRERLLQQLRLFNDTRELLRTITFRLTTTQIKRFDFNASVDFVWPKLLTENILFPTIQIEQEAVKVFTINNPSDQLLFIHLTLHDVNVHGADVDVIPTEILSKCTNCTLSEENVFSLFLFEEDDIYVNYVKPNSFLKVAVKFSANVPGTYSTIFYMRNNLTLIDAVWIQAKSVVPAFKFGNRKPGSPTALQFEITDKHLKVCSKPDQLDTEKDMFQPIQTKRTFTAKNYGEVPILISGIRVEDELCRGFGFKVFDCAPFELLPNASKKIEIAFVPDFTLGRVVRTLHFDSNINFPVNFTLLGTVPTHGLEMCSLSLKRPSIESTWRIVLFCILVVALIGTIFTSYLDANKVIAEHVQSLSREKGPLQPPLDLRQIALQNPLTADDPNEKDSSSPSTNQSTSKTNHHSNGNRKKVKPSYTKMGNGGAESSMHHGSNQFKKSWSEFTSKITRNKTDTVKSQQVTPESNNNQARNKRSITPPKEEVVVNNKEKSKPIIEEDSSSTTTESSAVSLPCSAMSDTLSTASSASSSDGGNEKQNYCSKNNNSANDSVDSNSMQQQNKSNKVKVNKTKSLPANYETSITANNSLSAKDTGNLNKNKENNVKAKVTKEKQMTNSVGITSINGTNQNGHPLSEQNNKNDKKFSKTPGRERKPVNPNNKKTVQAKPLYKAAAALQFPAVSVPQKINTQPIQTIANNNNNNIWTENRARFSDVVAQTPMEKSKMLQTFEQKYNYDKLNDQFKPNIFKNKDDNNVNDFKEPSCSPVDLGPIGGPKKSPSLSPNIKSWEPYGTFLTRPTPVSTVNSDSFFTTSFNDLKPATSTSEQQFNNLLQQQNSANQTNLSSLWEFNPYTMNNPYELWSTFQRQQIQQPIYNNPWQTNVPRPANVPIRAPPGFNVVRDRVALPTEQNIQNSSMSTFESSGFSLARDRGANLPSATSDPNASQATPIQAYDPFRSMDRFSIWGPETTTTNNNNDIWSIDPSNKNKKQD